MWRSSTLLALVCLVLIGHSLAQSGKGTIAGTVKDISNAVLPGAVVELQPSGNRVVSDRQGQFRITDLTPGKYTLTASYVGFAPYTKDLFVSGAQTVSMDATLQVATQSDQVIVTAERPHGEAEAINIQRAADNIVQVLPANVINSLPNTNVADAVGRLPSVSLERDEGEGKYVQIRGTEPRLSNTTIDGVNVPSPEGSVRNVKLDVIPADLVDRIEVHKTLSADQDGDAIGGSVNLVTKSPPESPTYSFSGEGGYTPIQNGRWLDSFGGTVGQRFGTTKKFGLLLGGTYDWNGRGIDDLEPSPAVGTFNGKNVAFFSSEDLRTYKYYRTRYGFVPEIDYRINRESNLYLTGLYSDFHDFGETWVYSPNAGSQITAANGPQLTFSNDGFMQYRHYIRRPDQQIFSLLTGGRHDLQSTLITYEFSGSRAHNIGGQDFATTHFAGPTGIVFGQDLSDPYRPKFPVLSNVAEFDPSAYTISSFVIPRQHSTQLNFQGATSVTRRYSLASHFGSFAIGLKVRNAHKTENQDDRFFNANGNNLLLSRTLGSYANPNYYDRSYTFGPLSDYNRVTALELSNLGLFAPDFGQDHIVSDGATFDANERIYAGYLMNTISINRFRVQTGVRIEGTGATYTANKITLNNGSYVSTLPISGSSDYVNVLPSFQVQYQITPETNVRGSFTRGISRPNFSDLVPSQQVDPNTSPSPSLVIGNPTLHPTKANNYDLLLEHFFNPLGVLQAGLFYKSLTDTIYPTTIHLTTGPFAGFDQQQSINGPSGRITGIEAAWEQRLSFLPGILQGFGVAANYSYTTSRVSFPLGFSGGRTDHPALQRQAPNNWNLGLTYDRSRFSMRFAVSHNDASIYSYFYQQTASPSDPIIGLKGPLGDQYLYAHTQFDLQGSYRVAKGFRMIVSGLNLSNEVFGFYQGSPRYPIQREYYHPTVALGLRWSSAAE